MKYVFEPVGQTAQELAARMLKAGHRLVSVLNGRVTMEPFELAEPFDDWVASMEKHFGCALVTE